MKREFQDQSAMGAILAEDETVIDLKRPEPRIIYHKPVNGVDVHEIPWPPKVQAQK